MDNIILHEIGEIQAGEILGGRWNEMLLSLEDEIFRDVLPEFVRRKLVVFAERQTTAWNVMARILVYAVQHTRSSQLARLRKAVRRADQNMGDLLAFGAQERRLVSRNRE